MANSRRMTPGEIANKVAKIVEARVREGMPAVLEPNKIEDPETQAKIQKFLQDLLDSGDDPVDAARQANEAFKLTTGNEAVYYEDTGALSIPSGYFIKESDGWKWIKRTAKRVQGPEDGVSGASGRIAKIAVLFAHMILAKSKPGKDENRTPSPDELDELDGMYKGEFPT